MLVELGLVVENVSHLFDHEQAVRRLHFQLACEQVNQIAHELSDCLLRWDCFDFTVASSLADLSEELAVEELGLVFGQGAGFSDDLRAENAYDA